MTDVEAHSGAGVWWRRAGRAVAALLLILAPSSGFAQGGNPPGNPKPQLVILDVTVGCPSACDQIQVKGANFGSGTPSVWIGATKQINILSPTDASFTVLRTLNPGSYLLTVSRGPSTTDIGSFVFTVGNQGPKGEAGAAGPQGSAGPQGATGPQGPAGPLGPAGATGAAGPSGAKGDTGAQGPAGPTGATGSQGPAGAMGPSGPPGAKGDTGAQGPVGPAGATGSQGSAGADGAPGLPGAKGDTGAQGLQGAKGDTGAQGPAGPAGALGPQGPAGPTGSQGPAGPMGLQGPQGVPGGVSGWERITNAVTMLASSGTTAYTLDATCSPGKRVLGGGFSFNSTAWQVLVINSSPPDSAGTLWRVRVRNVSPTADLVLNAFAICATAP